MSVTGGHRFDTVTASPLTARLSSSLVCLVLRQPIYICSLWLSEFHSVILSSQSACNWISGAKEISLVYLAQNNDLYSLLHDFLKPFQASLIKSFNSLSSKHSSALASHALCQSKQYVHVYYMQSKYRPTNEGSVCPTDKSKNPGQCFR